MTNYSSRRGVGDRLPRWVCLTPEPGKMGRNTGKIAAAGQNPQPPPSCILFMTKKKSGSAASQMCRLSESLWNKRYYSGTSALGGQMA